MTQATEYMLAELDKDGTTRPLPHCGSFYTDRWYGPDNDAVTGSDAAWRAVERVAATNPGMYTVIKVRTFERPEGQGLVGEPDLRAEVPAAPLRPGLLNRALAANPVWWQVAGVAVLVALGWVMSDRVFAAASAVWSFLKVNFA